MEMSRKLLKEASQTGHVKSRLFYTRLRMRHGRLFEKLLSPFFAINDLVYVLKIDRKPHDIRFLY